MKKILPLLLVILSFGSCKKCYDCTKKCGTCTLNAITVAGCTGDEALNNFSVDSWKLLLENQGYTCKYANVEEEACGQDDKENKEKGFYDCVSK